MRRIDKSVLIEHSAEQMFRLVDAVEEYPQFLPWCGGAEVKWRDELTTVATIHIDYHHVKQSFTTENAKQFPTRIDMKLLEGPFKHLDGRFRFTELAPHACKVEFQIEYQFSSKLIEVVIGPVFSHIADTLVEAFITRADKVYAK